jgi:transcriptional regulator with XRE-family HTH domain
MKKPSIGHNSKRKTKGKPDEIDAHIGKRLMIRRKLLGISQDKLAKVIGITFQQIQKYEQGKNRISSGRLLVFAAILGVPTTYFYDGLPVDILKKLYGLDAPLKENAPQNDQDALKLSQDYAFLKRHKPQSAQLFSKFLKTLIEETESQE